MEDEDMLSEQMRALYRIEEEERLARVEAERVEKELAREEAERDAMEAAEADSHQLRELVREEEKAARDLAEQSEKRRAMAAGLVEVLRPVDSTAPEFYEALTEMMGAKPAGSLLPPPPRTGRSNFESKTRMSI